MHGAFYFFIYFLFVKIHLGARSLYKAILKKVVLERIDCVSGFYLYSLFLFFLCYSYIHKRIIEELSIIIETISRARVLVASSPDKRENLQFNCGGGGGL